MQKLGKGGGTLGNMGNVADEMKKVEQDLRGGRITQETVERQQRILSRMLDAPRSVENATIRGSGSRGPAWTSSARRRARSRPNC